MNEKDEQQIEELVEQADDVVEHCEDTGRILAAIYFQGYVTGLERAKRPFSFSYDTPRSGVVIESILDEVGPKHSEIFPRLEAEIEGLQ